MGEMKNDGGNKNNGGGNGKKENAAEKKQNQPLTVVLKVDMHCDGCANKIAKFLRRLEGVETVKTETEQNKVTVVGFVDPAALREKLNQKTKKKVDLISPQPKKAENPEKKENKKPENEKKPENDGGNKKKEIPATTTAVLKLRLHCQGCINKIRKTISKTKGVKEVSMDEQKDLVTVKGTMDVKALAEVLKERLKRPVEVVPPKKEKEEGDGNGGGGGGKKKNKGGNEGGGGGNGKEENKVEQQNQFMVQVHPGFGYPYEQVPGYYYPYNPTHVSGYPVQVHAPQIFSDENPNACFIM